MPKTLNIAVIGAGTMAQAVHLPVLRRRWDRFSITALVDHSPRRRRESSEVWGIAEEKRYETVADLIAAVRAKTLSIEELLAKLRFAISYAENMEAGSDRWEKAMIEATAIEGEITARCSK